MTPIGVGVIGASPNGGWAALAHVPALRALPEYDLRAVATSRPESAERAKAAWGIDAYHDPRRLIERRDIDLVVVAVKVPDHYGLITDALTAGKAVFSEWPLGVALEQAQILHAEAVVAGVPTVVGLQARFAPAIRRMRELVDAGYVGKVLSTNIVGSGMAWAPGAPAAQAYAFDARNGVTTLTVSTAHALDALSYVLGDISSVTSTLGVGNDTITLDDGSTTTVTSPDQVAVTAQLESGAVASVFYRGGLSRAGNLRWEINGTHGDLLLTSPAPNGNIQATELVLAGANGSATHVEPIHTHDAHPETGLSGPANTVANLYRAFAHDQLLGTAAAPTFGDAVALHRLIAGIEHVNTESHRKY